MFAYGIFLFCVFVLVAYASFSFFVRSGVTTAPTVVGLTRADAANVLADQGLVLRGVETKGRYDDLVPAGQVLKQSPGARTLVKRGSGVEIVLSLGPQRIKVPDLAAKAFPAAQTTLSGSGLTLGTALAAFAGNSPPGTILGQDPDPGAMVPPATAVNVLLAAPASGPRYVMPDLVYRHYEDIRPYFEGAGFRLGNVKYERYEGVGAGIILRQFPLPGHPVTHQDAVSLVVATADGTEGGLAAPGAGPDGAAADAGTGTTGG